MSAFARFVRLLDPNDTGRNNPFMPALFRVELIRKKIL